MSTEVATHNVCFPFFATKRWKLALLSIGRNEQIAIFAVEINRCQIVRSYLYVPIFRGKQWLNIGTHIIPYFSHFSASIGEDDSIWYRKSTLCDKNSKRVRLCPTAIAPDDRFHVIPQRFKTPGRLPKSIPQC